ncbi:NADPH-flavin oxidoreductase [Desulfocucumis palustris]|uniref:NADPH-flavin oxidoreductase n=1 Tax=Desulfocucumis palustris TaxID=1898651 RepID=A0A2L2X972_9FIRM|nr:flavin reductase family protein [Desulfocucumis palustris]GBF32474.1 NADPH-flavin oxidoreductase [Desulfocucumis palustris]
MKKTKMGAKTFLYPMPTTLVGANINDKPNYLAVAYCGIVGTNPPVITIALRKSRYTNTGIRENGTFSVNLPSAEMVKVTDYCGLVSGRKFDKSRLFSTFYGELKTAPMIDECPVNLECKLIQTLDYIGSHDIYIGEVVEAYAGEQYITNGSPDIKKVNPILLSSTHDKNYWKVGEPLGKAWKIGEEYKPE